MLNIQLNTYNKADYLTEENLDFLLLLEDSSYDLFSLSLLLRFDAFLRASVLASKN